MGTTDFLFARPSFWGGAASVIDLGATLVEYNQSRTPEEADNRAIYADWLAIGEDLWAVVMQSREA